MTSIYILNLIINCILNYDFTFKDKDSIVPILGNIVDLVFRDYKETIKIILMKLFSLSLINFIELNVFKSMYLD